MEVPGRVPSGGTRRYLEVPRVLYSVLEVPRVLYSVLEVPGGLQGVLRRYQEASREYSQYSVREVSRGLRPPCTSLSSQRTGGRCQVGWEGWGQGTYSRAI